MPKGQAPSVRFELAKGNDAKPSAVDDGAGAVFAGVRSGHQGADAGWVFLESPVVVPQGGTPAPM